MEMELYRALIEDSPIFLVEVGQDGKILLANKALLDTLGKTHDEVVGKEFFTSFIPEIEHEKLNRLFGMIEIRSAERKVELELLTGSGAPLQVEWHGRTIREPGGLIKNFLCIGVNVTERKKGDEELIQTKEYLENVLENSPDAIGIVDSKGNFLQWNRMAAELYGYTLQELRGKAAFDLYADPESLKMMLEKLRTDGSVKNYEIDMKKKDGSIIPFDVSLSVLKEKDDTVVGSVCVARNLSEIKKTLHALAIANKRLEEEAAERQQTWEALRKSQNEYCTIFENTGNAMVIIEDDLIISLANSEFAKLSGYTKEDIQGKKGWTEFFHDESLAWVNDYHRFRKIDANAAPQNCEAIFKDSRGHCKDVFMTVASIPQSNKTVASLLDITERKRAEESLRQSHKELEQRSYEISQLNEMLDLLQVCHKREETYRIISHFVKKLFHSDSGFLGVFNDSHTVLEMALTWGEHESDDQSIQRDDCWGLRQGKVHHASTEPGGGVLCGHVRTTPGTFYLCVPLVAQGEVMGLFHLRTALQEEGHSGELLRRAMDAKQRLAAAVTDHIALALANLGLRETLSVQSIRDALSGLYNRRFMEETLDREVSRAKRHNLPLTIIMLDLDHFKRLNDTFGHDAGDYLLSEIGSLLENVVRGEDVACRYGGEEFIIIMPSTTLNVGQTRAEAIRQQIRNSKFSFQNRDIGLVTVSLGVALYDEHTMITTAQLLKAADTALYQAKERGRDRIVIAEGTK